MRGTVISRCFGEKKSLNCFRHDARVARRQSYSTTATNEMGGRVSGHIELSDEGLRDDGVFAPTIIVNSSLHSKLAGGYEYDR